MCAIIIAAETLSIEDRFGIDIFAECNYVQEPHCF